VGGFLRTEDTLTGAHDPGRLLCRHGPGIGHGWPARGIKTGTLTGANVSVASRI
jgi:hypothetical protein